MPRTKIVAGNWKMNLDRAEAKELAAAVAARRGEAEG
jgi:triosephosphate isomerase